MRVGRKNVLGLLNVDTWQKIYENELSSSATSVTISGLDGNTEENYFLFVTLKNGYAGTVTYRLRLNNDSGSNYGYQNIQAEGSTGTANRATDSGIILGYATAQDYMSQSTVNLFSKSGNNRLILVQRVYNLDETRTIGGIEVAGWSWNNSGSNITSMVIVGSQTDSIAVGSVIELWAKKEKI